MSTEYFARKAADFAFERKALDVIVIDLRQRSAYADFLVMASGTSDRHVQSISEHISTSLAKLGTKVQGIEGLREGQWALIDFGSIVVHVFHQYTRQVYDIEAMWEDAPRLCVCDTSTTVPISATH